jgi:outer membrane immunogenic protein
LGDSHILRIKLALIQAALLLAVALRQGGACEIFKIEQYPGLFMRHFIAGGLALLACGGAAKAADMPIKAPPPPPPPIFNWTGCYIGGSTGGVWPQGSNTTVTFIDGGSGAGPAAAAGALPTSFNYSGNGWIGGGQLGCSYQTSNWVFGIESDISGMKLNAGEVIGTNVPPFFPLTTSVTQDTNWIGTSRARLGWTWGNVLLYGTGGAAYGNVNYSYSQNNIAGGGPVAIAVTDSATQVGWTAGGGVEIGFGQWSLKGEYLFYDLGNHTLNAPCTTCTGVSPTVFFVHYRDTGNIARFGLNYRFY